MLDLGIRCCVNAHTAPCFKFHYAVNIGIEGIISSQADVRSRSEFRAALANDNRTCGYQFAAVSLYSAHLRIAVSSVLR